MAFLQKVNTKPEEWLKNEVSWQLGKIIDALNAADAGKWTGFEAVSYLDEGIADAQNAISLSKAVVSDGFPLACDASHHVHAGVGADLNYGLTQYTNRARTLQHYLGDAIYHRKRMASLIIKK